MSGYIYSFWIDIVFYTINFLIVFILSSVVLFVFKKEKIKNILQTCKLLFIALIPGYFISTWIWEFFVYSVKGDKLYYFWDHITWIGFFLLSHEAPRLEPGRGYYASGVTIFTLDLAWLLMLLFTFGSAVVLLKLIRTEKRLIRNAVFLLAISTIEVVVLNIIGRIFIS